MADIIYETLKKVTYDNLNQFVEDINRNFAIIQNSPLYKGLPGKGGLPGNAGGQGERGTRYFFVDANKFNEQFPNEILYGSSITLDWLNIKLEENDDEKAKVLKAFDTTEFVDTDIIVLTNSMMLQYVRQENQLKDTGIAFNEQQNLVSSIETKIDEAVQNAINKNETINSLENIFVKYVTIIKNYTTLNNSYITRKETDSSVYVPYLYGVSDRMGIESENHKYFGYSTTQFSTNDDGTIVFGSMEEYIQLLNKTTSVVEKDVFTSDYAPGKNNLPILVLVQNDFNSGILIGRNDGNGDEKNLKSYASIFKDSKANLIIKSDAGKNNFNTDGYLKPSNDFSKLVLTKFGAIFDKHLQVGEDLTVSNDFIQTDGNINTKFIRSNKFIPNNEDAFVDSPNKRENTKKSLELGFFETKNAQDTYYQNWFYNIKLPAFASNVFVADSTGVLSKLYSLETGNIPTVPNTNYLDNFDWILNDEHKIPTSNYLAAIVSKINQIQRGVKADYYRKQDFYYQQGNTDVGGVAIPQSDYPIIPSLHLKNKLIVNCESNGYVKFGIDDNVFFESSFSSRDLILGYKSDLNNGNKTKIQSQLLELPEYFVEEERLIPVIQEKNGTLQKNYFLEKKELTNKTIKNTTSFTAPYFHTNNGVADGSVRIQTSKYFQWLIDSIYSEYWHKDDWFPETAKIPALKLSTKLIGPNFVFNTENNINQIQLIPTSLLRLGSSKTITVNLNGQNVYGSWTGATPNKLISLDSSKKFVTEYFVESNKWNDVNANDKLLITSKIYKALYDSHVALQTNLKDNYWKKSEWAPTNQIPIIPDLLLSNTLIVPIANITDKLTSFDIKVTNNLSFNDEATIKHQKFEVKEDGVKIGFEEDINTNYGTSNQIILNSSKIKLPRFSETTVDYLYNTGKQLLTTNIDGELQVKYLVQDVEPERNVAVPENTDDNYTQFDAKAKTYRTIMSGSFGKYIVDFINNVKKRFKNTYSKKQVDDLVSNNINTGLYNHLPKGTIVLWNTYNKDNPNTPKPIPVGWVLCDGNNNTPNLVNCIPVGSNNMLSTNLSIVYTKGDDAPKIYQICYIMKI